MFPICLTGASALSVEHTFELETPTKCAQETNLDNVLDALRNSKTQKKMSNSTGAYDQDRVNKACDSPLCPKIGALSRSLPKSHMSAEIKKSKRKDCQAAKNARSGKPATTKRITPPAPIARPAPTPAPAPPPPPTRRLDPVREECRVTRKRILSVAWHTKHKEALDNGYSKEDAKRLARTAYAEKATELVRPW